MAVRPPEKVRVDVNHVLAVNGISIVCIRFLSDSFGHKKVQSTHVNIERSIMDKTAPKGSEGSRGRGTDAYKPPVEKDKHEPLEC